MGSRETASTSVSPYSVQTTENWSISLGRTEENQNLITYCYIPLQGQFVCQALADVHSQGMYGDYLTLLCVNANANRPKQHVLHRSAGVINVIESSRSCKETGTSAEKKPTESCISCMRPKIRIWWTLSHLQSAPPPTRVPNRNASTILCAETSQVSSGKLLFFHSQTCSTVMTRR